MDKWDAPSVRSCSGCLSAVFEDASEISVGDPTKSSQLEMDDDGWFSYGGCTKCMMM